MNSLPIEFADIVMFLTQLCIRSLLGCIRDRGRRDGETRGGCKDRKASSVGTGSSAEVAQDRNVGSSARENRGGPARKRSRSSRQAFTENLTHLVP